MDKEEDKTSIYGNHFAVFYFRHLGERYRNILFGDIYC